jgi:hypothetical protein
VLAGVLQRPLGLKADLDLADDRLALNATGTGVVQDERLDRTLAAAAAHVPGFVARMAQEHRSRMEALTARISTASLRRSWTDCMDEYTDAEMLLPRRLRLPWFQEEGREDVRRCLRVACWLRGLCSALTTYSEQAGTPHLKALWEAPIFLAPAGGLLCLRDLDEGGAPLERVALGKAEYDWLRLRYPERV